MIWNFEMSKQQMQQGKKSKNDNSTCMMPLNSFLACTYFYHCSLDKLVLLVSLYSKNSVIFVMNFGTLANHDVGAKIYS